MRLDELRNRGRQIIARKISAAPDLMRDILRRTDHGFEVGLIDIGFRTCSAQVSKSRAFDQLGDAPEWRSLA